MNVHAMFGPFPSWIVSQFHWKTAILASEMGHWIVLLTLPLSWLTRSQYKTQSRVLALASFGLLLPAWVSIGISRGVTGLWKWPDFSTPPGAQTFVYDTPHQLSLDFYRAFDPADVGHAGRNGPKPWVLVIHGGGWEAGSRAQLAHWNRVLLNEAIAVIQIDYRKSPKDLFPAPVEDARTAITFVKAKAAELGLDPNRFAILGRSAGGQIAELIAYDHPPLGLKAVIGFYAPSDLDFGYRVAAEDDFLHSRKLIEHYLGGKPDELPNVYAKASPLNFVNAQSTPTLLFHGKADALVWYRHSQRLQDALTKWAVKNEYLELPWATHGFDFNPYGPAGRLATQRTLEFLGSVF